jgi:DNA repair protein RecO (recombination protein O)
MMEGLAARQGSDGHTLASARVYTEDALVLRRISVGETDRILVLFTRERGKLSAIAKGARRPLSKIAGGSEPFSQSTIQLAMGQNLDVVTQCRVERSFPGLRRDLVKLAYGSYMLELAEAGIAERQPQPELWDLLVASLTLLEEASSPDLLARAYELSAMSLLGYEPDLERCVRDQAPVEAAGAAFHPLRGGLLCSRCGARTPGALPLSAEALAVMREMLHRPLNEYHRSELPRELRRELARSLVPYVRHRLEAPLRSLQFIEDVTADD